jgi:hypothetical protein
MCARNAQPADQPWHAERRVRARWRRRALVTESHLGPLRDFPPIADYERLAARRIGMGYEVQIGQVWAPVG